MDKGKRMGKIVIVIITLIIIAIIVGVVIFIKTRPQEIATKERNGQWQPMRESLVEGETEMTVENSNYVENQVVAVADSKREAKKIASQIGGELLSYENQIAIIQIGITVEEMMQKLEEDPSLPKVYPNYQSYSNYE